MYFLAPALDTRKIIFQFLLPLPPVGFKYICPADTNARALAMQAFVKKAAQSRTIGLLAPKLLDDLILQILCSFLEPEIVGLTLLSMIQTCKCALALIQEHMNTIKNG